MNGTSKSSPNVSFKADIMKGPSNPTLCATSVLSSKRLKMVIATSSKYGAFATSALVTPVNN